MEKKFYTDDFEHFLKETTDNFRMYPSKKVWHSIYNDLHPSRKWPSLVVWLFIISSIIFIGLSNKNHVEAFAITASGNNISSKTAFNNTALRHSNDIPAGKNLISNHELNNEHVQDLNFADSKNVAQNNMVSISTEEPNSNEQSKVLASSNKHVWKTKRASSLKVNNAGIAEENSGKVDNNISGSEIIVETKKPVDFLTSTNNLNIPASNEQETVDATQATKKNVAETKKGIAFEIKKLNNDREWIEDYAFHNKPFISKWKSRASYQFYMTPSVGFRTLIKNTEFNPVASSLIAPTTANTQDYKEALSQNAAVNMEIGANIRYNISKRWNLKIGLQFNYTNYAINAYELKHPTLTTVLFNDANNGFPVLSSRATTLANISGVSTKKLNNSSYQLSIPLGADIKLAGRNNLQWFAGATIQPTFISGGNSYLISSDLKNYVADNSLSRIWNLNAGIETFVSYKTNSGIIINAGPQLRYQLLSTYTSQYTYTEKLYNLGLKIGITTKF